MRWLRTLVASLALLALVSPAAAAAPPIKPTPAKARDAVRQQLRRTEQTINLADTPVKVGCRKAGTSVYTCRWSYTTTYTDVSGKARVRFYPHRIDVRLFDRECIAHDIDTCEIG